MVINEQEGQAWAARGRRFPPLRLSDESPSRTEEDSIPSGSIQPLSNHPSERFHFPVGLSRHPREDREEGESMMSETWDPASSIGIKTSAGNNLARAKRAGR